MVAMAVILSSWLSNFTEVIMSYIIKNNNFKMFNLLLNLCNEFNININWDLLCRNFLLFENKKIPQFNFFKWIVKKNIPNNTNLNHIFTNLICIQRDLKLYIDLLIDKGAQMMKINNTEYIYKPNYLYVLIKLKDTEICNNYLTPDDVIYLIRNGFDKNRLKDINLKY